MATQQFANPAEILAAGSRMHARMDEQTDNFKRIVAIGQNLSLSGMSSGAGRAAADKLASISTNADMQRDRSRQVVENLREYGNRTSDEADNTQSMVNSIES